MHTTGIHHYHKRKRTHTKKLEPVPSPDRFKRVVDGFVYVVAVFGPLITIPQIARIWETKDATGVSLTSWVGYLLIALFWLSYGIIHREQPIIYANATWIILEILVITGILLYGDQPRIFLELF